MPIYALIYFHMQIHTYILSMYINIYTYTSPYMIALFNTYIYTIYKNTTKINDYYLCIRLYHIYV